MSAAGRYENLPTDHAILTGNLAWNNSEEFLQTTPQRNKKALNLSITLMIEDGDLLKLFAPAIAGVVAAGLMPLVELS